MMTKMEKKQVPRYRFGVIVPSSNSTIEYEFTMVLQNKMLQNNPNHELSASNFSIHFGRLPLTQVTKEALKEMETHTLTEAEKLADAKVDIICYGCTSGSLIEGKEFSDALENKITEHTNIPAFTTAQAIVTSCKVLQIKQLTVLTPYIDSINILEKEFLESQNINVVAIKGFRLSSNTDIGKTAQQFTLKEAKKVYENHPSEGLFISCTNLRSFDILATLENELQCPVFSSNSASLFLLFKKLSYTPPEDTFAFLGQLFNRL
jgi:maleate isomerase